MNASDAIKASVTRRFEASPGRVFDAWLDPAKVRLWMGRALAGVGEMKRVEIDPRVGGKFCFSDMREAGEAVHVGEYLEIDRPRRLAFTWSATPGESSVVTIEIVPEGSGCVVTLTHEMDAKWAEYLGRVEGSWGKMLDSIASEAPGGS